MVNPLVQVFVLTVAIGFILGAGPHNLSAYIFCATIPWTFFQTAILDSSTSVLAKLGLLKKVYFPREIPLIATVCQNFVQFLISLGVFIVYRLVVTPLLFRGNVAPPLALLWLPVVVAILFLLTLGTAFFVATVNVFYEDVKFILTLTMGFLFYLMPIIYFAENIQFAARIRHGVLAACWWAYHLYLVNPMAWIITAFKQMFFGVSRHLQRRMPRSAIWQRAVRLALSADHRRHVRRVLPRRLRLLQQPQMEVHGAAMSEAPTLCHRDRGPGQRVPSLPPHLRVAQKPRRRAGQEPGP